MGNQIYIEIIVCDPYVWFIVAIYNKGDCKNKSANKYDKITDAIIVNYRPNTGEEWQQEKIG